jgi:hypothetical protein
MFRKGCCYFLSFKFGFLKLAHSKCISPSISFPLLLKKRPNNVRESNSNRSQEQSVKDTINSHTHQP